MKHCLLLLSQVKALRAAIVVKFQLHAVSVSGRSSKPIQLEGSGLLKEDSMVYC